MLLELGILGSCKVKMTLYNEPRLHVACRLSELTRETIARMKPTEVGAWNENDLPSEEDVAGLSYAMAKNWGRSVPQAFQDDISVPSLSALAPEVYCSSCQTISTTRDLFLEGIVSCLPWVSQDEGTETKSD
jgi:hypothetical protein